MADDEREAFSEQQRQAWERLVSRLRAVMAQSVALDAPAERLEQLTAQIDELERQLATISGAKPVPRFNVGRGMRVDNDFLPYSPISGKLNPIAPPVMLEVEGDKRVVGKVRFGPAYEGGVGFVHGGVVAMVWDQVLALATVAAGLPGPTGELSVRYLKPTRLGRDLRFEAWVERSEQRKTIARGRCMDGDEAVTEAEGLFIRLDARARRSDWGKQAAGALPQRRSEGDTNDE